MGETVDQRGAEPTPSERELRFSALEVLTHLLWWSAYVLSGLFIVHGATIYVVRSRVSARSSVLEAIVGAAKWFGRAAAWLRKFVGAPVRVKLFLEAGWPLSPYVLPWMAAPAAITADPTVERDGSEQIPEDTRRQVFARDDGRCVTCGQSADDTEVHIDHIIPVSRDGPNDSSNLRLLCRDCHEARHARLFDPGALRARF